MRKRSFLFSLFVLFFLLSLIFYLLFRDRSSQPGGVIAWVLTPFRETTYKAIVASDEKNTAVVKLMDENRALHMQLNQLEAMKKENSALRDQFQTTSLPSNKLLPAHVIGARGFIPGISEPEEFTLNVGSSEGVKKGQAVVYKDNLVGRVVRISTKLSVVSLVGNKETSLTGKTSQTDAQGILKGQGSGKMIFTNVVLSEKLTLDDTVLTKGDFDVLGAGLPEGLIIGKIVSVDKKASSLFQSAQVQSLVDMRHVSTVFIVTKIE